MSVLFFDFFFRLSGYVKLFSFKHVFYQLNSTIFVPICNTISYSIKAPLLMCNLHQEGYIYYERQKYYVSAHFRCLLTAFVLIRNILIAFTTSCVSIFDILNGILYTSSFFIFLSLIIPLPHQPQIMQISDLSKSYTCPCIL